MKEKKPVKKTRFTHGPLQGWEKIPLSRIDQKLYGRTVAAWCRITTGSLLLHHKPRSKMSAAYKMCGMWLLCHKGVLIGRRAYYGREYEVPPTKWANTKLQDLKLCKPKEKARPPRHYVRRSASLPLQESPAAPPIPPVTP